MNEHLEWLMAHASFPYSETGEAFKNFRGLVQHIERLEEMVALRDNLIENYQDANEEVTA